MVATSTDQQTTPETTEQPSPARVKVDRLHAAERDLIVRRMALDDDLERAQEAAGDAALAAAMGEPATQDATARLRQIRDDMAALEAAIMSARRQRLEAIPAIWREQAAQLRDQAAGVQAEVDQRQSKTAKLLEALLAHEGCAYVPDIPSRDEVSNRLLVHGTVEYTIPKTEALRNEIASLEQRVAELEARTVPLNGNIRAGSRNDLFRQLFDLDALQLGPHLFEALTWYDDATGRERERLRKAGYLPGEIQANMSVELVWIDGRVNQQRSRVLATHS